MWALKVVIGCVLAAYAAAHGGALHEGSPETARHVRVRVASCKKWVPASGRIKESAVVPTGTRMAPVDVKVRSLLLKTMNMYNG